MASARRARSRSPEKRTSTTTKKIKDLTEEEVTRLRAAIEAEGRVEGDLRKEMQMNVRRLIEIQAIADCVTAAIFPCAASVPIPTRAPAKDRARVQSPQRRK